MLQGYTIVELLSQSTGLLRMLVFIDGRRCYIPLAAVPPVATVPSGSLGITM